MTGPDHYSEGERLLDSVHIPMDAAVDTSLTLEQRIEASAMATAVATAALAHFAAATAAATALTGPMATYSDDPEILEWTKAAGVADD